MLNTRLAVASTIKSIGCNTGTYWRWVSYRGGGKKSRKRIFTEGFDEFCNTVSIFTVCLDAASLRPSQIFIGAFPYDCGDLCDIYLTNRKETGSCCSALGLFYELAQSD